MWVREAQANRPQGRRAGVSAGASWINPRCLYELLTAEPARHSVEPEPIAQVMETSVTAVVLDFINQVRMKRTAPEQATTQKLSQSPFCSE
jgi:hypothetical protein